MGEARRDSRRNESLERHLTSIRLCCKGFDVSKLKTLPEIIRDAIQRDGRTIYRLAIDSGVNQGVLGRFVRGERDMNLRTADRVCRALGLTLKRKGR